MNAASDMQTITLDDGGIQLAYIDSGVPPQAKNDYTTIFAIHGSAFTSPIFDKVMEVAGKHSVRFVAINRRDYPGSTPLSASDIEALSGSEEDKAAFLRARGHEFASFACKFAEENGIPSASQGGKTGGFAILGWSLGCALAHATVSHYDALLSAQKDYFAKNLRGLIILGSPTVSVGTPLPPRAWTPHIDTTMSASDRDGFFAHWITSYFQHGGLAARDLDTLAYVVPGTFRVPSLYGMSAAQLARMSYAPPAQTTDMLFMVGSTPAIHASYRRACFDRELRDTLPYMKVAVVMGDSDTALALSAYFAIQNNDDAHGGGFIRFKLLPKSNHFVQWDDPELALQTFIECIQ